MLSGDRERDERVPGGWGNRTRGQGQLQKSFLTLRNRIYYGVKPFVPLPARLAVRRWVAARQRKRVGAVWPILPGSERRPENWPGWPEGKQFAFVLTHDVEGPSGLAKCRRLVALERKYGFRSCFFFVPEGEYEVPRELRQDLQRDGFEVGVHDLHHDGRLFHGGLEFAKKVERINDYLAEWGAVGFRSGFMLHDLDRLGNLNVLYEASTFDTDPFEPQPDNAATIFPYWVRCRNASRRAGYIELPYTLPQDSTLFRILQERDFGIWARKLDWIAQHGGMALVNVHPDYLRFPGDASSPATFPVEVYERFLEYVSKTYGPSAWNALPREVAAHARTALADEPGSALVAKSTALDGHKASAALAGTGNGLPDSAAPGTPAGDARAASSAGRAGGKTRGAVLMIGYTEYISDGRVIREAEAALSGDFEVDFIGLRRASGPAVKEVRGVRLLNVAQSRYRGGGLFMYGLSYLEFLIRCFFKTTFLFFKRRYAAVHVHNMPDLFVFCALVPKLFGAKILLDIHDPMAETFASKFGGGGKTFFYRLLLLEERVSAWFADRIITVHDPVKEHILLKHGLSAESINVIANFADEAVFRVQERYAIDGRLRIVFHGTILERYGLAKVMEALAKLRHRNQVSMKIIGEGDFSDKLKAIIQARSLEDVVEFDNRVYPLHQIPELVATCNLGLVPIEISEITEYILPLKLLEYISMGIPPVTVRNVAISHYFSENDCFFYQPGQPQSLADLLDQIVENPEVLRRHREKALALRAKFLWNTQREKYVKLLHGLSGSRGSKTAPTETTAAPG